jgi:hypothetical protein
METRNCQTHRGTGFRQSKTNSMGRGEAPDYRPPQWPLSLWTFTHLHSRNSSLPSVNTSNKTKPLPISLSKSEGIDRAIDLVLASPRRWPTSDLDTRKFVLHRFSLCGDLPRKEIIRVTNSTCGRLCQKWRFVTSTKKMQPHRQGHIP